MKPDLCLLGKISRWVWVKWQSQPCHHCQHQPHGLCVAEKITGCITVLKELTTQHSTRKQHRNPEFNQSHIHRQIQRSESRARETDQGRGTGWRVGCKAKRAQTDKTLWQSNCVWGACLYSQVNRCDADVDPNAIRLIRPESRQRVRGKSPNCRKKGKTVTILMMPNRKPGWIHDTCLIFPPGSSQPPMQLSQLHKTSDGVLCKTSPASP